jgi:zinc/manganese transport system substrate-binding protein
MRSLIVSLLALCLGISAAEAAPIQIVAAENFYGDLAQQIGGDLVAVTSILTNPDQDPHLFEASPSTARQLDTARLVILNGADYDPWMVKLLGASRNSRRETIEVAKLLHREPGANPHLWYDPETMPKLAEALSKPLEAHDPEHMRAYERNLNAFIASLAPLKAKIAALKAAYADTPATATEPVFGYMAEAIGLQMRNGNFQLAVMNDTEPGASDIAAFENDLRTHQVKVLFYNSQTSGPLAAKMQGIARESGVPVVGVSETEPIGVKYQDWMLTQLNALDAALSGKTQ